jgi:predicted transcriptional regulator
MELLMSATDPMKPTDIAVAVGKNANAVSYLLGQMVAYGTVKKVSYGHYQMTEMQKENFRGGL